MRRSDLIRLGIALVLGLTAFVLLFPFAGIDTDPPVHYSVLGTEVPTDDSRLAALVGLATAVVAGPVLLLVERRS